jgi:sulfur relay (sulfurtransferase) DsrF/TusC family protein
MDPRAPFHIGLLIRSPAYQHRSARSQLDVAMLTATLDFDLSLYFLGEAVLQLAARDNTRPAMLPAGYRAWASLPELVEQGELKVFAEPAWLAKMQQNHMQACLDIQPANSAQMREDWAKCDRVLLL